MARRPFLAPEVIQTSEMDCGPASLKCLLAGWGIEASYNRLREACQTDIDGSSIDTIEDVANMLGVPVIQQLVPRDGLFDVVDQIAPALIVTRTPAGFPHFAILWRRVGNRVHVMDPGIGRKWMTRAELERDVYRHKQQLPLDVYVRLAKKSATSASIRASLEQIGADAQVKAMLERALEEQNALSVVGMDAAARFVRRLVRQKVLRRGSEANETLVRLLAKFHENPMAAIRNWPRDDWWVAPSKERADMLDTRGTVILACRPGEQNESARKPMRTERIPAGVLRAVQEKPTNAWSEIWSTLGSEARRSAIFLTLVSLISVGVLVSEALLMRASLELPRLLGVVQQRIGASIAFAVFLIVLLLLELVVARGTLRLGRVIETQLRVSTLLKIPRLVDNYLRSRPVSDMAQRAHALHELHELPATVTNTLQNMVELTVVIAAIAFIDWRSGLIALVGAVVCTFYMSLAMPMLKEREATAQSHAGALTTSYLDSLLGMIPIRTHASEDTIRHEHENRMVGWLGAGRNAVRSYVVTQGIFGLLITLFIILVIGDYVRRSSHREGLLLMLFWTQRLPDLARSIVSNLRTWPRLEHRVERVIEPLAAAEREVAAADALPVSAAPPTIQMHGVTVAAGGKTILSDLNVTIQPGSKVGIVGRSGAGKSSFVGLLLGLYTPSEGMAYIDGRPLEPAVLEALRRRTAWLDPSVQLWNRSLLDNVLYGTESRPVRPLEDIIDQADLKEFVERMPRGLQSRLGESGALVSGGEGQRVRFGRALAPADAKLVILDEAFRGLDRDRRREFLARARELWRDATILCVTHDVSDTLDLDRVLVFVDGKLAEDGEPRVLGKDKDTEYRSLLLAEVETRARVWGAPGWKHWEIREGKLTETQDAGSMILGRKLEPTETETQ